MIVVMEPDATDASVENVISFLVNAGFDVHRSSGATTTMQTVILLAGDIDGNNVIDQFDAMTIGMNYNLAAPTAADLNDDGIINILDLELLAGNYGQSGALAWATQ